MLRILHALSSFQTTVSGRDHYFSYFIDTENWNVNEVKILTLSHTATDPAMWVLIINRGASLPPPTCFTPGRGRVACWQISSILVCSVAEENYRSSKIPLFSSRFITSREFISLWPQHALPPCLLDHLLGSYLKLSFLLFPEPWGT